jgi:hypothetical protein
MNFDMEQQSVFGVLDRARNYLVCSIAHAHKKGEAPKPKLVNMKWPYFPKGFISSSEGFRPR